MKPTLLSALWRVGMALLPWWHATPVLALAPTGQRPDSVLPPASVSARRALLPERMAVPHHTLDSTALLRRGVTDTGDALRRLPGVNLRDYGGAGGLKTVSVRGLGAAHTVVSYDGLPVGAARQGETDLGRFDADHLASVTLRVADDGRLLTPVRTLGAAVVELRGPAPDAVPHGLHGRASLTAAAFGTAKPALLLTLGASPRTTLTAAADFHYGRNDYPFRLRNGILETRERRTNSRMQAWRAELGAMHRTRRGGSWRSKLYFYDNRRRLPGAVKLYTDDASEHLAERQVAAQTAWRQRVGRGWEVMAAGKYATDRSRYVDRGDEWPGGALVQRYRSHEAYATAGAALSRGPWQAALATDYTFERLRSNLDGTRRVERHSWQPALSLRYAAGGFAATVRLLGAAFVNHAAAGQKAARNARRLSPSLSLAWRPRRGGLVVRAYYKELFRTASFTECYYYHYGSQDLRPETTRQIGAGLTWTHGTADGPLSLRLVADGYLNRVADRITGIPVNLFIWQTFNMGRVRIGGADASLDATWRPARGHALYLAVGYTLQRGSDRTDPASASYGKQPAYMPVHSGSASLAWENPWFGLVVHATAASARWATNEHVATTRLPGYVEAGAAVYRTLHAGRFRIDLRADLVNAFDKQYEIIRRYPMPGRAWKLSATIGW